MTLRCGKTNRRRPSRHRERPPTLGFRADLFYALDLSWHVPGTSYIRLHGPHLRLGRVKTAVIRLTPCCVVLIEETATVLRLSPGRDAMYVGIGSGWVPAVKTKIGQCKKNLERLNIC